MNSYASFIIIIESTDDPQDENRIPSKFVENTHKPIRWLQKINSSSQTYRDKNIGRQMRASKPSHNNEVYTQRSNMIANIATLIKYPALRQK